jgi:hypothetical protein
MMAENAGAEAEVPPISTNEVSMFVGSQELKPGGKKSAWQII